MSIYTGLFLLVSFVLTTGLAADEFEWTGSAGNNLWNDAGNWNNVTPGGGTDDDGIPDSDDSARFPIDAFVAGGSVFDLIIDPAIVVTFGGIVSGIFHANTVGIEGTISNEGTIGFLADSQGNDITGPDQRLRVFADSEVNLEGGGTVEFNGLETGVLGEGILNNIDNDIRGSGTVELTGLEFTVNNQGTISPEAGEMIFRNVTLNNTGGLIDVTPSGIFRAPGSTVSGGVLNGQPGSTFNGSSFSDMVLTGTNRVGGLVSGIFHANTAGFEGTITNEGTIEFQADSQGNDITGPDQRILIDSEVTLTGLGSIVLNGNETGIFSPNSSTLINDGNTIRGHGIVSAVVDNSGTLFTDTSAGNLVFQNAVVLRPSSVLAVGLNGFNFSQSRELVFDSPLDINGTLKLVVGSNFDAVIGETHQILTTPILGGPAEFPQLDLSMTQSLTRGFEFAIVYTANSISVEVTDRYLRGDINLDGIVNLLDVAPFVNLITEGGMQREGDLNGDGMVNLLDVAPFVTLLTG